MSNNTQLDHQAHHHGDGEDDDSDGRLARHANVLVEEGNPLAPLARVLAQRDGGT